MKRFACSILLALAITPVAVFSQTRVGDLDHVGAVLDTFHQAASEADFEAYFRLFATEAVFLGTDASERWTVGEFKAYARPHFDRGRGWTYTATDRHVNFAEDGTVAWFDELLDNENLGQCRGSGVLTKVGDDWKIAQYNLAIPIPNDLASDVVAMIRSLPSVNR